MLPTAWVAQHILRRMGISESGQGILLLLTENLTQLWPYDSCRTLWWQPQGWWHWTKEETFITMTQMRTNLMLAPSALYATHLVFTHQPWLLNTFIISISQLREDSHSEEGTKHCKPSQASPESELSVTLLMLPWRCQAWQGHQCDWHWQGVVVGSQGQEGKPKIPGCFTYALW